MTLYLVPPPSKCTRLLCTSSASLYSASMGDRSACKTEHHVKGLVSCFSQAENTQLKQRLYSPR